jgi:hypothetical protein
MYKKRSADYTAFAKNNRKSIGQGHTVVPVMVLSKFEKKTEKMQTYYSLMVQTLNKEPVFIQMASIKDPVTKSNVPFEPPSAKRAKVEDSEEDDEDVDGEEEDVTSEFVKEDGRWGVTVNPGTMMWVTTFDRAGGKVVDRSSVAKLSLIADSYKGRVGFKAGEVIFEAPPGVTRALFTKYFVDSSMVVVPTKDNIDPADFPEGTKSEHISRAFVLPLSSDTDLFTDVEVIVDPEDPKRFVGKKKDVQKEFPSVNTDTGGDSPQNAFSVVYKEKNGTKYFFKYAYFPEVWSCFGIAEVDKWALCAGRLMFSAVSWFAQGSSKLDNILSMRANADADDGMDFGGDDADPYMASYGEEPCAADSSMTEAAAGGMVATTGFIASMSVDLVATVKKAGIALPLKWVGEYSSGMYKYQIKKTDSPDDAVKNTLNDDWRISLERRAKVVYNFTEMVDVDRANFLRELEGRTDVCFYGIFAVGDDRPYEYVGDDFGGYMSTNRLFPVTIFAL